MLQYKGLLSELKSFFKHKINSKIFSRFSKVSKMNFIAFIEQNTNVFNLFFKTYFADWINVLLQSFKKCDKEIQIVLVKS